MALLSLQGVTLNLGGKTLLDTADLHVEQGERVCLVGRNGVGKSSLMALLSGDLTPDGGTIVRTPGVTFGHMPQAVPDHWSGPVFGVVASGLGKEGEALAAAHLIATGREDQLSAAKLALARDLGWTDALAGGLTPFLPGAVLKSATAWLILAGLRRSPYWR